MSLPSISIGSAVFAQLTVVPFDHHHMPMVYVSESIMSGMTPHEHLDRSCSFAHHVGHSIGLSSVPPFLRMSASFNRTIQHVWVCAVSTSCLV